MGTIRVITSKEIEEILSFQELIPKMEQMFEDYYNGKGIVFPVVREELPDKSGIFGIKSGYSLNNNIVGYKSGGFWEKNMDNNIPNHQSVIILHNASNGVPLCLMDGNIITVLRTGAANAVALKYLARMNSSSLAILGTGMQGMIQTRAALEVLPMIKTIYCYDVFKPSVDNYLSKEAFWNPEGKHLRIVRVEDERLAINNPDGDADVIITTTPSRKAHVKGEWIRSGMHLSTIGADTKGKQEIDASIFLKSRIIVDDWEQASTIGESQHAFNDGLISEPYALLSEIISGLKPGRESENDITIFDATGIALQDIYTGYYVYQKAVERGLGIEIEL